jgi:hypothetical protein
MLNSDILQLSLHICGVCDGLLLYAQLFDLEIKGHDHIWYEGPMCLNELGSWIT